MPDICCQMMMMSCQKWDVTPPCRGASSWAWTGGGSRWCCRPLSCSHGFPLEDTYARLKKAAIWMWCRSAWNKTIRFHIIFHDNASSLVWNYGIFLIQFSQGLVPRAWCRRHVWRLVQTFKSGQPPLLDRQHLVTISWAQDTLDLSCYYTNIKKHPKTFQTHSNLRSLLLMNISQGLYVLQSYMKPQFDKNRRTWNWSNTPDILNKNYETSEQLI